MLIGHSLGGLMVINTLIKHPQLFNKYLAIDPSLWWDDLKLLKESEHALQQQTFEGKSLYVSIANTVPMDTLAAQRDTSESTAHFRAIMNFVGMLRKNSPRGLDWRAQFYPEDNHGSVALVSELDALRFLYRKIPIRLAPEALKAFEGRYKHQFEKGVDSFLDVVADGDLLMVKESWSTYPMKFSPISNTEFYCFQKSFPMAFKRNEAGEVSELVAFNTDVWTKVY
jgi:pimeloyl-ACP methyl ester carboxylesterase